MAFNKRYISWHHFDVPSLPETGALTRGCVAASKPSDTCCGILTGQTAKGRTASCRRARHQVGVAVGKVVAAVTDAALAPITNVLK